MSLEGLQVYVTQQCKLLQDYITSKDKAEKGIFKRNQKDEWLTPFIFYFA
jgi:hypothetical protein